MMPVTKKIYSCFFIVILAIPFSWLIMLQVKQAMVRHEMKEKLERSFLQKITLHKDEVYWVKMNREIRIGNELFDVKSYYEADSLVHFTGLFDHEETTIEKQLGNFSGKRTEEKQRLGGLLVFLQNLYTENPVSDLNKPASAAEGYHTGKTIFLRDFPHSVIPPPPRS